MIFGVIGSVGLVLLRRVLGLLGIGPAADAKDVEITVLRRRRHPSNPHADAERLIRTVRTECLDWLLIRKARPVVCGSVKDPGTEASCRLAGCPTGTPNVRRGSGSCSPAFVSRRSSRILVARERREEISWACTVRAPLVRGGTA